MGRQGREPLLEASRLGKQFGATRALDDVSLQLWAGDVHCVLGENGAGKSTLGKIVGGVHRADSGELRIGGRAVSFAGPREARAAGVTLVHQELSLAPQLSVRANLWLGAERRRAPFALTDARHETDGARRMLARLGLADLDLEQPVQRLPAAVQQLVEIGKALMADPQIVIFDEPTAMLGAVEKMRFFEVLRSLRADGLACALVTHHVEDVLAVGDRVTVMRNGGVVDTFAMTPDIDADEIVARLTGRRRNAPVRERGGAGTRARLLDIEGLAGAAGPQVLSVGRGEIVGFYGVVGCGAEAVLRGLVGLAEAGDPALSFRLDGRAYRPASPHHALRHGVAYLPAGRASHGILPDRPIRENLLLTQFARLGRCGFIGPARERQRGDELLEACQVKFGDAADPITSLSGGNQQKVLLARAMAGARHLLVLEEPGAGIDIDAKHQIHLRIREAARNGLTVVVLSSDLRETVALCDTVVTMFAGRLANLYREPGEHDVPAIVADVLGQHETPTGVRAPGPAARHGEAAPHA